MNNPDAFMTRAEVADLLRAISAGLGEVVKDARNMKHLSPLDVAITNAVNCVENVIWEEARKLNPEQDNPDA